MSPDFAARAEKRGTDDSRRVDAESGAIHLSISGVVQGVGYRAWMVDLASELKVVGWVRNRRDGTVEAHAQAQRSVLAVLVEKCRHGPRHARVKDVAVIDVPAESLGSFLARDTA